MLRVSLFQAARRVVAPYGESGPRRVGGSGDPPLQGNFGPERCDGHRSHETAPVPLEPNRAVKNAVGASPRLARPRFIGTAPSDSPPIPHLLPRLVGTGKETRPTGRNPCEAARRVVAPYGRHGPRWARGSGDPPLQRLRRNTAKPDNGRGKPLPYGAVERHSPAEDRRAATWDRPYGFSGRSQQDRGVGGLTPAERKSQQKNRPHRGSRFLTNEGTIRGA